MVPAKYVTDGIRIVKQWRRQAESGQPFACDAFACNVLYLDKNPELDDSLKAEDKPTEPSVTHDLVVCSIYRRQNIKSLPFDCSIVAQFDDKTALLLAPRFNARRPENMNSDIGG